MSTTQGLKLASIASQVATERLEGGPSGSGTPAKDKKMLFGGTSAATADPGAGKPLPEPVRDPIDVPVQEIFDELVAWMKIELDIDAKDVTMASELAKDLRLDQLAVVEMWEFLADQFQLECVPQPAIWEPDTVEQVCVEAQKVIADPTSYIPMIEEEEAVPCAFMFPGQGAQKVGMARKVTEACGPAKELFAKASAILGYDLLDVCLNGPADKLNQTDVCQPAMLVASLAKLEELKENQPNLVAACDVCCGLSLGEYAALVFAGALSFEDAVRVVSVRGQAMQRASSLVPSAMTSVLGLDLKTVRQLVVDSLSLVAKADNPPPSPAVLVVANDLCAGNTAVSGHLVCLDAVEQLAMGEQYAAKKVTRLAVAGAFHSSLMEPAVGDLAKVLETVTLNKPRIPVVLNTTGTATVDPDEIRKQLALQVTSPVQWRATMEHLVQSHEQVHEIGPGGVLKGIARHVTRQLKKPSVKLEHHDA